MLGLNFTYVDRLQQMELIAEIWMVSEEMQLVV